MMDYSNYKHVLYNPDSQTVAAVLRNAADVTGTSPDVKPTNPICIWTKETLAELQAQYPNAYVCTSDEAIEAIRTDATKPPQQITEQLYWEAMEVLPPRRQETRHYGDYSIQSFYMSEFWTLDITTHYLKITHVPADITLYFSIQHPAKTTAIDLAQMCIDQLLENVEVDNE